MSEETCNDCTFYYLTTSVLVIALWLAVAVTLWYLKMRKDTGSKENLSAAQEMADISHGDEDARRLGAAGGQGGHPETNDNIIYHEVVLNKHNLKSKEPKAEETTYAEIKNASQQDDTLIYTEINPNVKRRAKNLPQDTDPSSTYAEVKLMPEKLKSDVNKDLYACVNKK